MSSYDVVIRGGEVVTAGSRQRADVGIAHGRIVQIGGALDGDLVVDADECLVLPGGVDPHVHLSPVETEEGPHQWRDDFRTGTRAAARGGVTTVGNMTFTRPGEPLSEAAVRVAEEAEAAACVDVFLHPVVGGRAQCDVGEVARLEAVGQTSIKIFTTFPDFSRYREDYYELMAAAAGRGFLCVVHCEDPAVIDHAVRDLVTQGLADHCHYGASRPVASEEAAVRQVSALAEVAGIPLYVVHLSSARALAACADARRQGAEIYVETRPLYLYLTEERLAEPDGAKYIGQPPLRAPSDVDALWRGLGHGEVDTVGTDHATWTLEEKLAAGSSLVDLRPGVADLETLRPMLFSEGVLKGRISLERFVAVTATTPAKLFGLFPQKGVIAPGSDADIVVWDRQRRQVVDGSTMESGAGYSPYDGWEVQGWPRFTLSRGEVVATEDQVSGAPGRGRVVRRGPTERP